MYMFGSLPLQSSTSDSSSLVGAPVYSTLTIHTHLIVYFGIKSIPHSHKIGCEEMGVRWGRWSGEQEKGREAEQRLIYKRKN